MSTDVEKAAHKAELEMLKNHTEKIFDEARELERNLAEQIRDLQVVQTQLEAQIVQIETLINS